MGTTMPGLASRFFIIGVTGHRRLPQQPERLARVVAAELERLRASFGRRPCVLLSPLAEGADRLVAKAALKGLQARLVVPLPLPIKTYEEDFPATTGEFAQLLSQANTVVEAPLLSADGAWGQPGEARDRQYAWVGAYVADHVHVLIALWDGEPARGEGGTALIVDRFRARLEGKPGAGLCGEPKFPRPRLVLPAAEAELLIHITPETGAVRRYWRKVRRAVKI